MPMEGINDRYNVEFEVLTPLAICSGAEKDWINGMDFVVSNGRLFKLNLQKLAAAGIDMLKLAACFENNDVVGVKELIGNKLGSVSDFSLSLPSGISGDNGFANSVKSFIKNQLWDKPIVPGSSIKGAVRSIIFEYLTKGDRRGRDYCPKINRIFGEPADGTDFMRFVKFSDIEFEKTSLVNTKIFNLRGDDRRNWQGGWKHGRKNTSEHFSNTGFNTVYEVLPSGSRGLCAVMLSGKMFSYVSEGIAYAEKKEKLLAQSNSAPIVLFEIINAHTLSYLSKEKIFFGKYEAERTQRIVDCIESLIHKVKSLQDAGNKSCIFKMSAGSGFHSITGDWQFDDYSIDGLDNKKGISRGLYHGYKSSKSRKIAVDGDSLSLMGFVKMSVADAETVERYEEVKQERVCLRKQRYEEKKAAEERLRLENEERLRLGQEIERKRLAYDAAIDKAERYYLGENCDNAVALSLFKEAEAIWPEGTHHKERIAGLQRLLDDEKAQRDREKVANDEKEGLVKAGLSNLDRKNANDASQYLINSFKQVENSVKGWLKKSRQDSVPDSEDVYLVATLSRIIRDNSKERKELADFTSSCWQKVCQWCGEPRAKHIFNEVTKS